MCGIAGLLHIDGSPVSPDLLRRMTQSLLHRGPDGEGVWSQGAVGLGHRRLSVLDLTDAGRQPMADEGEQVVISYNGEIYNFKELRRSLESLGHRFRSQTDTEVVLKAFSQWGESCVSKFNGMFAFAIWDSSRKTLFLARDRFGIKPLYWHFDGRTFTFASEIKAILCNASIKRDVDLHALNEYFTFQNILTDLTLFKGIRLLPPGSTMALAVGQTSAPRARRFWDYSFNPQNQWNDAEAEEQLYRLFTQSVQRQLVSDVPIGAYLSGGMDSGSIVSVARQHLGRLKTFTGGFDLSSASGLELGFDERAQSEYLSNLLKTEHYEMVMHAGDMEYVMSDLIWHLEDLRVGQCYPNFYVARLAGKFVKVTLSGAGGDELFGGYPWRYYIGMDQSSPATYYQSYYSFWQRLVPDEQKSVLFNAPTYAPLRDHSTFDVFQDVFPKGCALGSADDRLSASLYFELKTFLHGLLVVEDKVSMAHALETRVPFLDNDLVDFALQLPSRMKLRDRKSGARIDENTPGKKMLYEEKTNDGKLILRKAMSRLIPDEVTRRTKQGFSAPDASWFRGESIDYINRVLRNPKAALFQFLNPAYVSQVLDEHCSGKINRRLLIWSFLSFETWLQTFIVHPRPTEGHA